MPQCFKYTTLTQPEHIALKQLYKGEADAYQQRLALSAIVNNLCRSHDNCFIPGAADESNFIAGRAFVGQKILLHLNVAVGKLKQEEDSDNADKQT